MPAGPALETADRQGPDGLVLGRAARLFDYWVTVYRRTWKGSAASSFVVPLLYILAMGVFLGGFVEADPETLEGARSYLAFVAPGMLAAQTMTTVFGETTYPVMGYLKWDRSYFAMIATPLSVADIVFANLAFVTARIALVSGVFVLVMAPFGVFASPFGVVAAFAVQPLIGMAFATPVYAFTVWLRNENGFAVIFRLGMIPMFLFSGAFFPVGNLDPWMQALARATPLWHGVDLTRSLVLGRAETGPVLLHLGYLTTLVLVGWWLAVRLLRRRLHG